MFQTRRTAIAFLMSGLTAVLAFSGCKKEPPKPPAAPPKPAEPPHVSEIDLRSYKPNEAGAVMVIMYHHIDARKPNGDMNRTPEQFRKDLQVLYDRGYRPVTVRQFAENKMDVPGGKTPVVLTFDDSYLTQFRYKDPAGSEIDPDCAVGIMEEFSRTHPEWKPRATFFVLQGGKNPPAFYQYGLTSQKFSHLIEIGCEIGSHSLNHANFRRLQPSQIMHEVAGSIKAIQEQCPDAQITSLAIPYGRIPRNPSALKACIEGSADGISYKMTALVMASWRPTLAPMGKPHLKTPFGGQVAPGNPHHIERLLPNPRKASIPGTLEFYLKLFDENPGLRYVSDGNPSVAAVPQGFASMVDAAAIARSGIRLQLYSLASPRGVSGSARRVGGE